MLLSYSHFRPFILIHYSIDHPPKKLKNLCRCHGIKLLFLSAYSLDYNPIEKSWANMKCALIDKIPGCEDVPAAVYQYFGVNIF
jgi:hypothetical protein